MTLCRRGNECDARMQIIYNGAEITDSVNPLGLQITDQASGKPDSITASFADPNGTWSKWKPEKNHTLQVIENGFDTGIMFIDQLAQNAGIFGMKALSIPHTSKTARSQAWEQARLLEIASEISRRYGFSLQVYGVINHLYNRIDQHEEPDFVFLNRLCVQEGYALKITARKVIIYDEHLQEQKPISPNLSAFGAGVMNDSYGFKDHSVEVYQKCIVHSQSPDGYLAGEYSAPDVIGPTVKRHLYAANQAEADRWAKGILRNYNKYMITGSFTANLQPGLAAGTNIRVEDVGMFDGKYFIDRIVHDLINNKTKLTLRKPLEGY